MRKRTSLRRWKARCRAGRAIPLIAIVERQLERWFRFRCINYLTEHYRMVP